MNHEKTYAIQFAERKAKKAQFWFIVLWCTYLWFVAVGWILVIAVPFGLAIMLYLPQEQTRSLTIWLLIASAAGVILHLIASVMRFKERANRARRLFNMLDYSILKFREGRIEKEELIAGIERFLEEDAEEETP